MKCVNCNKKIKTDDTYCSNCGINLKNIEILNEEKKKSNILFIIVVFILLIFSISLSVFLILNNKEKEKTNEEKTIVVESNEVLFKNYILNVPEGFKKENNKKITYIKNNDLIIIYKEYPLSFNQLDNNSELLKNTLIDQGYIIEKYEVRKIDEKEYITISAKLDEIDYALVFYEFDDEANIFLTVTSNYLSKINEKWFEIAIDFIKSNRKI